MKAQWSWSVETGRRKGFGANVVSTRNCAFTREKFGKLLLLLSFVVGEFGGEEMVGDVIVMVGEVKFDATCCEKIFLR